MMETDFKARGEASGVRGSKGPPTRPTRAGGPAGRQGGKNRRLIPLKAFYDDMMGYSRSWYYRHRGRPGFPVEVTVEGWPRLVLDECLAYQARFIEARDQRH